MKRVGDTESARLDDAARAGWLYYVARNTQDEIAKKLGVSRQSAQRLVSLAVTEGLVKVRLDHPIARCMELARALTDRYGLIACDVVPSDPEAPELLTGVAGAAADEIARVISDPTPHILALGTGRALKAAIEQLPQMDCPQHRIVSLIGNMMRDGAATPFNATIRLAEKVGAPHYPMPLPVIARTPEERAVLHAQEPVVNTLDLCARADIAFVGVGEMGPEAPLVKDGFVSPETMRAWTAAGAVGEITSWIYDAKGVLLSGALGELTTAAPLIRNPQRPVFAVASGPAKVLAIKGALTGGLIQGLFTNEATAAAILGQA